MNSYPILSNQTDTDNLYVDYNDGRIRLDNVFINDRLNFQENLKYPKNIDPFKCYGQIVLIIILILVLCILICLSYLLKMFIPEAYIEFGFCGIMFIQCCLLLIFYSTSMSWAYYLSDSGFFIFPRALSWKRNLIIFVWSGSIFFLTPVLLAIKTFCLHVKVNSSKVSCTGNLTNIDLMEIYVDIETVLIILSIGIYLFDIIKFRLKRSWPDVWHEKLLDESHIVDWCPIVAQCELRTECTNNSCNIALANQTSSALTSSYQHHIITSCSTNPSSIRDLMHAQSYLIMYLRRLNNTLSKRIYQLNQRIKNQPHPPSPQQNQQRSESQHNLLVHSASSSSLSSR